VYFGGPDRPLGALRDLLLQRVADTPAGGEIDWVTYYFRDRPLARELVRAAQRGVNVRLVLEDRPRIAWANDEVKALLSGEDGLGAGLRLLRLPGIPAPRGLAWKPQLHEKIYAFSHPRPHVLIGSFNPSGDFPEETPEILPRIGDHNIAHNALVEAGDPQLVTIFRRHIRGLHRRGASLLHRFRADPDRSIDLGHSQLHFWPRLGRHPVERLLRDFSGAGPCRIRIAASHIRNPGAIRRIIGVARSGAGIEILSEHTARRVPPRTERKLTAAGIRFRRLGAEQNVPMHLKFVLLERDSEKLSVFGSINWTLPSYWLNHEIAVVTSDHHVFDAFEARWQDLQAMSGPSR
jgi:phosphatidylserine/phosphatidylglycerophosphate/cardiolipin synthase-like enzyme